MKTINIIFFTLALPLFLQAQYVPELDVRGSNDIANGAEFQLATPTETNFLRFFSGRSGDPNPYLYFSNQDTFRIATGTSDFSNFTERLTILPNGKIGINTSQPQSLLHVNGDLSMPWDVIFKHHRPGVSNPERIYLRKGWNSNLWNYLYLGATGNRDNVEQGAMILSHQKGIAFGKGHNDGDQLSETHMVIDSSGKMRIHSLAGKGTRPLLAEADGSIIVDNNNLAIKMKKLTGTSSSSPTGAVTIAHGISDISKILSISVIMGNSQGLIPSGFLLNGNDNLYLFNYLVDETNIQVINFSYDPCFLPPCLDQSPIISLPINVLISYED